MKWIFSLILCCFYLASIIGVEPQPRVIILLGAPASGKGTQATFIAGRLDIPHISTGDLFRENIKNQTKLGQEAQKFINDGKLVPDSLVLDMLFARIAQPDAQKGYLLDGFPRTVPQAEAYRDHIGNQIKPTVINIEVPDQILLERIAARQKVEGRSDDIKEIAEKRLAVYKEQTAPLISYYSKEGNLHTIQGNASIDTVQSQILNLIK